MLSKKRKKITIQKDSQLVSIYASGILTFTQKKIYNYLLFATKNFLMIDSKQFIFHLPMSDLISYISDKNLNYQQIADSLKSLKDITVYYNVLEKSKNTSIDIFSLVGGINIKNGIITYNLDFQVLYYIKNPSTYAYLDLNVMKALNTKHSISLYEVMQDYKGLKIVELEIEKLKKAMDIKVEDYERFDVFKSKVLDPSIKLINNNTDLIISYEKILKIRKVIGLRFYITEDKEKLEKNILKTKNLTLKKFIEFIRKNHTNQPLFYVKFTKFNNVTIYISCNSDGLLCDFKTKEILNKEMSLNLWDLLHEQYKLGNLMIQKKL